MSDRRTIEDTITLVNKLGVEKTAKLIEMQREMIVEYKSRLERTQLAVCDTCLNKITCVADSWVRTHDKDGFLCDNFASGTVEQPEVAALKSRLGEAERDKTCETCNGYDNKEERYIGDCWQCSRFYADMYENAQVVDGGGE